MYSVEEVNGEVPSTPQLQPMRISDNGVTGSAEEITSEVLLPDSRIPSTPEVGTESNGGDIGTEWNIDEQDAWFAGAFCNNWQTVSATKKTLTLGDVSHSFSFFEKFPQTPVAWQHYKKEFVNSVSMDFATDSFVKLTWNFMGSNNPEMKDDFPLEGVTPTFLEASKTKSFITKSGMWLKVGDTVGTLEALRQSPSMNLSISNNLERTPALGEDESIENSLGDFVVEGTLDVYNVDDKGKSLYNDAVKGKDKVLQIAVSRKVGTVTTRYTLTLNVHFGAPTKSKNGNKLQFAIPFKVNDDTDLLLEKEVIDESTPVVVEPETPVFTNTLENVSYTVGATATALDATATVTDGGTVTYSWKVNDTEVGTDATYTPSTATESETELTVTATNTLNGLTATASQTVTVKVTKE